MLLDPIPGGHHLSGQVHVLRNGERVKRARGFTKRSIHRGMWYCTNRTLPLLRLLTGKPLRWLIRVRTGWLMHTGRILPAVQFSNSLATGKCRNPRRPKLVRLFIYLTAWNRRDRILQSCNQFCSGVFHPAAEDHFGRLPASTLSEMVLHFRVTHSKSIRVTFCAASFDWRVLMAEVSITFPSSTDCRLRLFERQVSTSLCGVMKRWKHTVLLPRPAATRQTQIRRFRRLIYKRRLAIQA